MEKMRQYNARIDSFTNTMVRVYVYSPINTPIASSIFESGAVAPNMSTKAARYYYSIASACGSSTNLMASLSQFPLTRVKGKKYRQLTKYSDLKHRGS